MMYRSKKTSQEKNRKYFKLNENKTMTYQNLQYAAKVMSIEKFIVVNTYVRKEEKSQINNLNSTLRNQKIIENEIEIKQKKYNDLQINQ